MAESDDENQTGQTSIYNRSKSGSRDRCRYTTCACVFALTALVTDRAVTTVGAAVAGVAAVVAPLGLPTLICVMCIEYQLEYYKNIIQMDTLSLEVQTHLSPSDFKGVHVKCSD